MALIDALSTLPWIQAFTAAHLVAAADRWSATADLWEGSFTRLARDVLRPGGAEWTGGGAEAAQDSVDKSALAARGAANQLRDAAGIATFGADQLDGLCAKTLDAPGGDMPPANGHNGIQLVDYRVPLPESPKNPPPEPPPGGWSNDPITRAAQKITYGHAWRDHSGEFPGMTKDQLAQQIEKMFRTNAENPASLTIGRTLDGAPVLHDPKTNIVVIRDPSAADAGTAFKPTKGADSAARARSAAVRREQQDRHPGSLDTAWRTRRGSFQTRTSRGG